jgi:low temperature requirement protein LtrA
MAGAVPEESHGTEPRVTSLELFFDLVFVFAITQTTSFISAEPSGRRLLEALAILAAVWWAWAAFAWLGNTAAADSGLLRLTLLTAMAAILIASLAVPRAFAGDGAIFGVAYLAVRVLHVVAYLVMARGDAVLRRVVVRLVFSMLPASLLILAAGFLDGGPRAVCWALALLVDYGGLAVVGVSGWAVRPAHFAERHGLIVIIALGESVVAVGVGAEDHRLSAGVITGAILGLAAIASLWWAYFDVVALVGERRLTDAGPIERARIARDSYTYLHLPMVAGIVLFAVGVKKTLAHVGEPLHTVPAIGLCGGIALYLVALSAFKRRNVGSFNQPRLVAGVVLAASVPLALTLPAIASIAVVTAISCALVAYEFVRYGGARTRIRST